MDNMVLVDIPPSRVGVRMIAWPGGKTRLQKWIYHQMPHHQFGDYYEPFFGGGAVYFQTPSLHGKKSYISDTNRELMNYWTTLRDQPEELHDVLCEHKANTSKDYFLMVRDIHNMWDMVAEPRSDSIDRAGRFGYLVNGCFNSKYTVNREGKFTGCPGTSCQPENRPPHILPGDGGWWDLHVPDLEVFMTYSDILSRCNIACQDYASIEPQAGDLVYLDPPYASTTHVYTSDLFDRREQLRLYENATKWSEDGVYVMVSNSGSSFIRDLWGQWKIHEKTISYYMGGGHQDYPKRTELLITNIGKGVKYRRGSQKTKTRCASSSGVCHSNHASGDWWYL